MNFPRLVNRFPALFSRWLLLVGVCLLTAAALIDPADKIFHMKIPAFALIVVVWLGRRGVRKGTVPPRVWIGVIGLGVMVPLLWTVLGLVRYNVHSDDVSFGVIKSFLFLFIVPVVLSEDIDLASLIMRLGSVVALLTFVMVGVSFLAPAVFYVLYAFSLQKENAIITESRDLVGLGIGMFYFKTSALLTLPFSHYSSRLAGVGPGKWRVLALWACYGVALIFSGARANFLATLGIAAFFGARYLARKLGWVPASMFILAGALASTSTLVVKLANPAESSNAIKLKHMQSYEQEFVSHPSYLLLGQGADTTFYSTGFQSWTTSTELSYLDLIRVYGVPMSLLMFGCLAWLVLKLLKSERYGLAIGFIGYLLISGSNPLLISSTGFLAICAVWKEVEFPSSKNSAFHLADLPTVVPRRLFASWIVPTRGKIPLSLERN
ncbi:MAG TPA: hypothetical protein VJQ54_05050 [Candidatus Sulfotelmatobacter sp.]|nr:hypothetical protein [Candidatus Sulfotelmatobacter sp.]